MRKITSGLFISLDGVVERPDAWHFPYFNDEMGAAVDAMAKSADAMLFGRKTYEEFASYWPEHANDDFGAFLNNTPKYVVSSTLDRADWTNSTLIKGDVVEQITRLKNEPGKNISMTGSGTLVRWLLENALLDELHLLMHPIVVGSGKRLFELDGAQVPLQLVESQTFSTGVLHLTYARAES